MSLEGRCSCCRYVEGYREYLFQFERLSLQNVDEIVDHPTRQAANLRIKKHTYTIYNNSSKSVDVLK